MGKEKSITKFANSLKEFLINAAANRVESVQSLAHKYNNLTVYMDPSKEKDPHFFVTFGISEACFTIDDGKKIDGSLGMEDGYVMRWASRTNIKGELSECWRMIKSEYDKIEDDEEARNVEINANKKLKQKEPEASVDMLGTGINRIKRKQSEINKKEDDIENDDK